MYISGQDWKLIEVKHRLQYSKKKKFSKPGFVETLDKEWCTEFRLLVIQFSNNLSEMKSNYKKGVKGIRDMANNWKLRYLTIFGKTFMLPKLTHIATVVPSSTAIQKEEVEKICKDFIRSTSPTVADIKSFYTPAKKGGFGLHKVADLWSSIEMSWLRCLPYTKSLWKHLHVKEINNGLQYGRTRPGKEKNQEPGLAWGL